MKKAVVVLLGPHGSGKDTQGEALVNKLGANFISVSDALKYASVNIPEYKDKYKPEAHMAAGKLVSDIGVETALDFVMRYAPKDKIVTALAGTCRNPSQVPDVLHLIEKYYTHHLVLFIMMNLNDFLIFRRLEGRKKKSEMERRPIRLDDDQRIWNKLIDDDMKMIPLVVAEILRHKHEINYVNAGSTPEKVFADICKLLEKYHIIFPKHQTVEPSQLAAAAFLE